MSTPSFCAHIEKRRLHRWYCVTREISAYRGNAVYNNVYEIHGPFRLKRDAKLVKASAKKSYAEARKGDI